MQRLLYHAPDNPNQESPFDRAIVQVVQGQDVSIVSPYIGVQYLHRLIGMSRSWRLISDVLEWLSATPVSERGAVYEFLKQNDGQVHHYPAIHAKTVVSRVGAYTGSANLTDAGVLRRTEFGVLLTDPEQVHEIQQWFDAIWCQTSPPPLLSVLNLIEELAQISHIAAGFADLKASQLESGARRVRAKLVKILGHEPLAISGRHQATTGSGVPASAPAVAPMPATAPLITNVQSQSTEPTSQTQLTRGSTSSLATPPSPLQPRSFDLEAEIEAYVDRNAVGSFSFAEVHQAMCRKSPTLTRRETYFAILESCASHPRTLFSPDAVHRLVYRNGRFVQSSKELLTTVLKPLDELVTEIIESLSFSEPTPAASVSTAQGINIGLHKLVLRGMLQAEFVVQVDAGLKLAPSAQWSPRLKLLERSHIRWTNRLTQHNFKRSPGLQAVAASLESLPEPSTQGPVEEPSVTSMEGAFEPQEELIQKRNEQLDTVFSHLAGLRSTFGEKTEILMGVLKNELVRKSGLREEDVKRLLNGTYRMYRSPFLAVVTGNLGTVDIIADLDGNPHLQDLPNTRKAVEFSPVLRELQSSPRPQQIILTPTSQNQVTRVRLDTFKDADEAYLLMVQWIFRARPASRPRTENDLLTMLQSSGVSRDHLRRLLFDRSGSFPMLFTLWRKDNQSRLVSVKPGSMVEVSIRLHHASLAHYPNTHSYLKTVVWPSSGEHNWLQSPEQQRASLAEARKTHALHELQGKHSNRDKAYCALFSFIWKRIPKFERFSTSERLVTALAQSKVERFTIEYLLGIDSKPPQQLLHIQEDDFGFFLKTDPQLLLTYKRCKKFAERVVEQGGDQHSWLSFPAPQPAQVPPISFTPPLARFPQVELAPLHWDDRQLLEIDTLYAELAKLFNERPSAVLGSPEASAQYREATVAKYLRICEVRNSSDKKPPPVLSLEFPDGADRKVEVVIYRGYQEYIHQYPKLQRYLAKTSLKLREV